MRPQLEVADILRQHGAVWQAAHAGHVSLAQLKVVSAIEHRTAALGGHVEACEGCRHTRIAYNSCRNRHCPKCQGAARATGWPSGRPTFCRSATSSSSRCRPPWPRSPSTTRPRCTTSISGGVGDHADDRGRPEAPRRPHRHHGRAPPGARPDPLRTSMIVPGGHLARRGALGSGAAGLPVACARARQAVPPPVPRRARRPPRRGPAPLLRRPGRVGARTGVPPPARAHPQAGLGGVRQAALWRTRSGAGLPSALRTASPSRTSA